MLQKGYTENSVYCNFVGSAKNCYLAFMSGGDVSNLLYCSHVRHGSENCSECSYMRECRLCYQCVDAVNGYNLRFCQRTENCSDSWFLRDCIGCSNCFGCANLRHKEYHWFNEPMTKEAYQTKMKEVLPYLATHSGLLRTRERANAFWLSHPVKHLNLTHCEDCTGDDLENCKNMRATFDTFDSESGAYSTAISLSKDFRDWDNYGKNSELILECVGVGSQCYQLITNVFSYNSCARVFYCIDAFSCQDCFGCIGLTGKKYCVLNKQYTKEEYEELVPRIIKPMQSIPSTLIEGEKSKVQNENTNRPSSIINFQFGEFFPPSLSPFGYNETVAMEYYPLEKEEALRLGFNWSDYVSPPPVAEAQDVASLPDSIHDVPDSIVDKAITCEVSGKPFRIIKQELRFLREHGLPLPRRHPDVRHLDRMKLRNPRKLFSRTCANCSKPIQTTYAPERSERVFCEECYLKEVY